MDESDFLIGILFGILIALVVWWIAPYPSIDNSQINRAIALCAPNGGIKKVRPEYGATVSVTVQCNNEGEFVVKELIQGGETER